MVAKAARLETELHFLDVVTTVETAIERLDSKGAGSNKGLH